MGTEMDQIAGTSSSTNDDVKPWLNSEGKRLSENEIKLASKRWGAETWERFLIATVDKEISRQECVIEDYPDLLDDQTETVWDVHSSVPEHVHKKIHSSITTLTVPQKSVVRGIYFYELTERQLARKLNLTQPTINGTKKLSLKKIKVLIESDPISAAYLIGGSANLPLRVQTEKQELLQVYRADLNGSYMK
jgi:DNA-directed RNA polymerase specialized sigma24 family protein